MQVILVMYIGNAGHVGNACHTGNISNTGNMGTVNIAYYLY